TKSHHQRTMLTWPDRYNMRSLFGNIKNNTGPKMVDHSIHSPDLGILIINIRSWLLLETEEDMYLLLGSLNSYLMSLYKTVFLERQLNALDKSTNDKSEK
ncbi:hypothetical protein HHI36_011772, partial [Cryptolaemus montrouzieri]